MIVSLQADTTTESWTVESKSDKILLNDPDLTRRIINNLNMGKLKQKIHTFDKRNIQLRAINI